FTLAGVVALVASRSSAIPQPRPHPFRCLEASRALRLVALAIAPLVVLVALRVAYFHDVLPNTFYAKMRALDGRDFTGLGYALNALRRRPLLLLLLPAASLF